MYFFWKVHIASEKNLLKVPSTKDGSNKLKEAHVYIYDGIANGEYITNGEGKEIKCTVQ